MRIFSYPLLALIIALYSSIAYAQPTEVAVVVSNKIEQNLSIEQLRHIFLGRAVLTSGNRKIKPVVLTQSNRLHRGFSTQVMSRSVAQLKAYWSRSLFTGKGTLPKVVKSVDDIKRLISSDDTYIGYMPIDQVDASLRVVFLFEFE